jgi:hypothetical protein
VALRPNRLRRGPIGALLALSLLGCLPLPLGPRTVAPLAPSEIEAWQATASELRGLEFRDPVRIEWIESGDIPGIVRAEVEATFDPSYVVAYRDAYAALGLFPPDLDLLETIMALQAEQLVGLYSVSRRTLYVVSAAREQYGAPTILVHELVHALQHQHFPRTVAMLQRLENNDDLAGALGAAVEGDASLTMLAVEGSEEARTLEAARGFRRAMLADLRHPTGLLAEVPRLLRVTLIAPYAYGVVAAARLFEESGTVGLDALIDDPPISGLHVVYPEERAAIDFVRLPLEWLESELAAEGCRAGHHNVAGVIAIRVLFEEFAPGVEADPVLRAWRGDRFVELRCPKRGGLGALLGRKLGLARGEESRLLWVLRFSDPESAEEFARVYASVAPGAAGRAGAAAPPEVVVVERSAVVFSPALRGLATEALRRSEVRSYRSLEEWIEGACFPDASCIEWKDAAAPRPEETPPD